MTFGEKVVVNKNSRNILAILYIYTYPITKFVRS